MIRLCVYMYVVCIYKPMWQHTICCTVASCYCLCLILYICVLDATVLYMLTTCSIVVNLLCCIYRGHTERIRRKGANRQHSEGSYGLVAYLGCRDLNSQKRIIKILLCTPLLVTCGACGMCVKETALHYLHYITLPCCPRDVDT